MDMKECIQNRRSIRRYTRQQITRETLEQIVGLAAYAPSWKNSQIARYTFVTDRAVIEKIANECVLGFTHNSGIILNCNVLAIQSIVLKHSGYERDGSFSTGKGTHWESFDAGISAQTFCLAAHDFGVGTCILGIFDDQKVAEAINLPSTQSVSCLIPMGYPAENPAAPARKSAGELARFIG
ncbi:MAG: nitroreductase family protein [Ruminococcaceae bacterium]|jgi:nitroreductase|nr:nitroreductase family protein [Oscillospiraceae bacterium]